MKVSIDCKSKKEKFTSFGDNLDLLYFLKQFGKNSTQFHSALENFVFFLLFLTTDVKYNKNCCIEWK